MKNIGLIITAVIVTAAIVAANVLLFTVREDEQVIITYLGDPIKTIEEPGLNFKNPLAKVVYLKKWNLEYDIERGRELEIIAANEERLIIDAFVRYRIVNPLDYYQSFKQGTGDWNTLKSVGERRINAVLESALRQSLGEVTINEIITTKRAELMNSIQAQMEVEAEKFGVEVIDVRIRRADFPDQNAQKVYARMQSERLQQAQLTRAEGEEEAKRIRADAQKQRTTIIANAEEQAQKIRGRADRERNAVFADAYNRDPEFFAFYRSLLSYEQALQAGETTIVLSPDSEFFRYFKDLNGR